jgi:hypothetical protein
VSMTGGARCKMVATGLAGGVVRGEVRFEAVW